jgi:hypothetical protein
MYNKSVFQAEPIRKAFLLSLFEQNVLHVTLLKLDEEIIASNVGITGRNWVHLQGINTHSPAHSRYSPGILHFLLLSGSLAEEGIQVFDLTPGADAYKDALATDYTQAYELSIGSRHHIAVKKLKHKAIEYLKKNLPKIGIQQSKMKAALYNASILKERAKNLKSQGVQPLFHFLLSQAASKSSPVTFILDSEITSTKFKPVLPVKKDSLSELLFYSPVGAITTKWEFLTDAMKKFELGQHVYTWSTDGCLLACAWLSKSAAYDKTMSVEGVNILSDFYIHPIARKQASQFLQTVIEMVTKESDKIPLLAVSNRPNQWLCKSLTEIGFVHLK